VAYEGHGIRWQIPCRTTTCKKYLDKLNPSGDWVPYKVNDIDHEDDDAFWDGTKPTKKMFKHGSPKYGHITLGRRLYDRMPNQRRERMIVT